MQVSENDPQLVQLASQTLGCNERSPCVRIWLGRGTCLSAPVHLFRTAAAIRPPNPRPVRTSHYSYRYRHFQVARTPPFMPDVYPSSLLQFSSASHPATTRRGNSLLYPGRSPQDSPTWSPYYAGMYMNATLYLTQPPPRGRKTLESRVT